MTTILLPTSAKEAHMEGSLVSDLEKESAEQCGRNKKTDHSYLLGPHALILHGKKGQIVFVQRCGQSCSSRRARKVVPRSPTSTNLTWEDKCPLG